MECPLTEYHPFLKVSPFTHSYILYPIPFDQNFGYISINYTAKGVGKTIDVPLASELRRQGAWVYRRKKSVGHVAKVSAMSDEKRSGTKGRRAGRADRGSRCRAEAEKNDDGG